MAGIIGPLYGARQRGLNAFLQDDSISRINVFKTSFKYSFKKNNLYILNNFQYLTVFHYITNKTFSDVMRYFNYVFYVRLLNKIILL